MGDRARRAQLLKEQRDHKMREVFQGRRYRIVREFELDEDDSVRSIFGYRLRRGFVLQEISEPDNTFAVGYVVLKAAEREFGAVTVPKKRRGRPPADAVADPTRISSLLLG